MFYKKNRVLIKDNGEKISYLKTYSDACLAMGLTYNDITKEFFKRMERYGHTERSICYAAYKIGDKIIDYLMGKFRKGENYGDGRYKTITFIKYDEETFETIRNYLKKYSWEKDDRRWITYCEKKKVETENKIKIEKAMEEDNKLEIEYKNGKYQGAKLETRKEDGLYRKVLVQYYVYFIQGVCGGAIKIGYSANPEKRLKVLQTGYPDILKILLVIPGDETLEKKIHNELKDYRLSGEWFKPDKAVFDKIKELSKAQQRLQR